MEVAEVETFSDLAGRSIRVEIENGLIKAIGHIVKDDWFRPEEDFKE